ncbi:uncharacterized protein TNCV_3216391 [Trichonephila clavipes]|nr:uncharacterized protein TNCV_3216391 [Trichonephila clavipes]
MRVIGKRFSAGKKLFSMLNIPYPSKCTYRQQEIKLLHAASKAANSSMLESAKFIVKCSNECGVSVHWCAKIKDEVEKLAYQLNEEAERTERPIRRLRKVMYGSTCADMQVDVMGECLSSIKHVVGVRSVFLAKRLHAV